MKISLPSNRPFFPEADRREIAEHLSDILADGRLTQGPWVSKLEAAFAAQCGAKYAIATNSGTSALEILLRYFDVAGHEVIMPTNTFLATGNAVIFAGGTPVLADICADSLCIDPDDVVRRITPQTKGIIAVHIAGLVDRRFESIRAICREHGLFLLEDAAHAPGASLSGVSAGNLGNGGAFSFYPTKPMTTGEGGMITTNDQQCYEMAQSLRCHGIAIGEESSGNNKNLLLRLGHNWRMSEFQAVIGYYQVKRLHQAIAERNRIAGQYRQSLGSVDGLSFFPETEDSIHSYYKFPILLERHGSRQTVSKALLTNYGIQSGSIYWPPCHLQPFYREKFGFREGDFPVAEDILERTLALPIYPDMRKRDIENVSNALKSILKESPINTLEREAT